MRQPTRIGRASGALIAAVIGAGVVHGIAGGHLGAVDPIAALVGGRGAGAAVLTAAVGLAAARLFLIFVAPAWAAHLVVKAIARATRVPPWEPR